MNRATAEVQKTLSEEEGLAPVLAWIKALVDDVLADEFDPGLEFVWSPTATIDPEAQERMLSSYTSRGTLTLNEARAALGRAPLADGAADAPMVLTAGGYVGLGQDAAATSRKRAASLNQLSKDQAWNEASHWRWPAGDERGGRFAPSASLATGLSPDPTTSPTPRTHRAHLAEVIPVCIKGLHSSGLVDGIMTFWAEHHCFDGSSLERRSIGQELDGIVLQP